MTVYIVNLLCSDDSEDNTQVVGVYSTRDKAEAACSSGDLAELDTSIEEWEVQ
jgi:hypothetical protein